MDEARALIESDPPTAQIVWAGEQMAGRGRLGRSWSSPPGNLYATTAIRNPRGAAEAPECSFIAVLAMRDAMIAVTGLPSEQVRLKWPNDILVNGAKAAGLLLEMGGPRNGWILIGSGVNITSHPPDTPYPATDLAGEGAPIKPGDLLGRYLFALSTRRETWRLQGFEPIRRDWMAAGPPLGAPVTIRADAAPVTGAFKGLDTRGGLLLECEGVTRKFDAGDVLAAPADRAVFGES